MRYTTVIDISKLALYRNPNVRLVYFHLCLRVGYHDDDRDMVALSYRQLAAEVGITLSACRHALKILTDHKMVYQRDGIIWVRKWLQEPQITPRKESAKQAAKQAQEQEANRIRKAAQEAEDAHRKMMADLKSSGKTSLQVYLERLEARAAEGDQEAIEILRRRKHDNTKGN